MMTLKNNYIVAYTEYLINYGVKYGKFKEDLSQSLSALFYRYDVDAEFQKKLCDNIYNTFNV